jgi:hypothetical protein
MRSFDESSSHTLACCLFGKSGSVASLHLVGPAETKLVRLFAAQFIDECLTLLHCTIVPGPSTLKRVRCPSRRVTKTKKSLPERKREMQLGSFSRACRDDRLDSSFVCSGFRPWHWRERDSDPYDEADKDDGSRTVRHNSARRWPSTPVRQRIDPPLAIRACAPKPAHSPHQSHSTSHRRMGSRPLTADGDEGGMMAVLF